MKAYAQNRRREDSQRKMNEVISAADRKQLRQLMYTQERDKSRIGFV